MSQKVKHSSGAPRAVLDAFFPQEICIGDIKIAPCSLGHFLALERIGSPVLGDMTNVKFEDAARALFLLSLNCDEAMRMAGDREAMEANFREFCRRVPAREIAGVTPKLLTMLNAAFATVVPSSGGESSGPLPRFPAEAPASAGS